MSSPAKRMRPASGRRSPASWLMKVVLPAPFGPMSACVSPSATWKSMPSLARSAPKLLKRPFTSSIGLEEDTGQAAAEEDHRKDQQRAEDHLPVLGPALQRFLDEQQRERPEDRAGGAGHAAQDHHEHHLARLVPGHQSGSDVAGMVGVQGACHAAHRAGDGEGGQAKRKWKQVNASQT